MSHQAIARFADGSRLRLTLTGRGAFSSTRQRAQWAAADALRAPVDGCGPVDRVEIVSGGCVVEVVRAHEADPWAIEGDEK